MIPLDVASLVVIASGALGTGTDTALDLLDVAAAETALAQAHDGSTQAHDGSSGEPAAAAAALLDALIQHRPFRRANDLIAVAATVQLLSVNGWQADLNPPGATLAALARLAAGELDRDGLAAWLAPRLTPRLYRSQTAMHRWMPRRMQRAAGGHAQPRLTGPGRQAVVTAQEEARRLGHPSIGTEHLLLGLLDDSGGLVRPVLAARGIRADDVRQQVLAIARPGAGAPDRHIPFTPRAKAALGLSLREATRLDHLFVGSEHLLLGLVREGHGVAAQVLRGLGGDLDGFRGTVTGLTAARGGQPGGHQQSA
jgi:prophage maintenance system killer protein